MGFDDKATQFYHGDIYGTNVPTALTLSQGVHTLRLRIKARGSAKFRAAFLSEIQPFTAVVYTPAVLPDLVSYSIMICCVGLMEGLYEQLTLCRWMALSLERRIVVSLQFEY